MTGMTGVEVTCARHGRPYLRGGPYRAGDCRYCWVHRGEAGPPARGPCHWLGKRTQFRPGCGGRNCEHVCDAGEPVAVPGGVCLTCPKWVAQ